MTDNYNEVISKKTVRSWLEGYSELYRAWGTTHIPDPPKGDVGKKPADGITDKVLCRAMLSAALRHMWREDGKLFYCCIARWIRPEPLGKTLRHTGLTKDKYYQRCDWAVDYIYFHVNNMDMDRAELLQRLRRKEIKKICLQKSEYHGKIS